MSYRSFAAGMLVGLIAPAIIVIAMMALDAGPEDGLVAPGSQGTPVATSSATSAASGTQTKPTSPTKAPTAATQPTPVPTTGNADYQVENVEIPAGRMVYLVFSLPENYTLEGYFTVDGAQDNIVFWATDPADKNILDKSEVRERGDFSLTATKGGSYTLYLDNSASNSAPRQVAVYYRLKSQ